MKDPSKPDGEAVNADGSLKDADQIKWVDSPTDELRPPVLGPNEDTGMRDAAEPREMPVQYNDREIDDFAMDIYEDFDRDKGEEVDDNLKDDKVDEEDEENEEDGSEEEDNIDAAEEEIDEEADKRYWEAKAKEGVRKVA
jgi:hypothetical protein